MPQHKNKQQAFQAAQQGYAQAKEVYESLDSNSSEYGHYKKRLAQEVNEAEQQIENALEVSSEHQAKQLEQYRNELEEMKQE
ncbi:hypothetical protein OEV98_14150 [Caldibacillus lycopersici]|uniref:Small, acid-soluble spore protein N n=1 Tax=Perspicuibacillus lycopersici TaxID=1325689 RepID=A0AAE3LP86_9BACI|nr:hypothetical protein [Perspicuibacillus lycopersici]MCU9614682.1 hypothetical protein [Perspicuibacillus lycopersici]